MINPELLTDDLAEQVAEEAICTCCAEHVEEHITDRIVDYTIKELLDNIMPSVNELRRLAHFEKLFKSLKPYEKQYKAMLATVWEKERRIVVANIKKMKKAWLSKDKIDDLLYPVGQFEKELSANALKINTTIVDAQGNVAMNELAAVDVMFDVTNPEVQKWLKSYTPKFSKALEEVSTTKLRRELTQGIDAGEGIPQLIKRVNNTYAHWNKVRSESIARSETMRAANQGSIEAYKQSGVVKAKVWVTHFDARTCAWCKKMDGKVISIEKSFFSQGSRFTVNVEGNRQTMKLDYETVDAPPLHTVCRCTVAASFEEVEGKPPPPGEAEEVARKPRKPFKNLKEAEEWGKKYKINGLTVNNKKLSLKEWNSIADQVDKIPNKLLTKIAKNGGSMDLVVDSGVTVHPDYKYLKGQTPRGWTSGNWDNVPGAGGTWNNPKTVIVANRTAFGHGSANLTLHEHAHTVDSIFVKGSGRLSDSKKWQGLWGANKKKGIIASPYQIDYAEEYFAESFAEYFNTPGHGSLPKNVITYFTNLVTGLK